MLSKDSMEHSEKVKALEEYTKACEELSAFMRIQGPPRTQKEVDDLHEAHDKYLKIVNRTRKALFE